MRFALQKWWPRSDSHRHLLRFRQALRLHQLHGQGVEESGGLDPQPLARPTRLANGDSGLAVSLSIRMTEVAGSLGTAPSEAGFGVQSAPCALPTRSGAPSGNRTRTSSRTQVLSLVCLLFHHGGGGRGEVVPRAGLAPALPFGLRGLNAATLLFVHRGVKWRRGQESHLQPRFQGSLVSSQVPRLFGPSPRKDQRPSSPWPSRAGLCLRVRASKAPLAAAHQAYNLARALKWWGCSVLPRVGPVALSLQPSPSL